MTTVALDPDPVTIRQVLERQRAEGTPFAPAFAKATEPYPETTDNRPVLRFMRKHFKAAYESDGSSHGRCMVPARDTSTAIPMTAFASRNPDRDAAIIQAVRLGQTCKVVGLAHGISATRVSAIVTEADSAVAPPKASHDYERCRSGDGCDRLAIRGRFGLMWCEYHGAELERLADDVRLARSKADPRNGGNSSLYTHKAA